MKRIIYTLFIVLLIATIVISSYFIYKELKQNKKQEETFEELIEIIENSNENNKKEDEIELRQLYEINNDLVGWLKIENTTIDYPVMKSKIKNYYLKKDFYKNYSSYGTPFLSEGCNISESDNLIIYGHHMKNRKMFGCLEDYKSQEFYEENKIIEFYILNGDETIKTNYEIFAVFKTVVYTSNCFKYYNCIDFCNENEFNSFVDKVQDISIYKTNIIPKYGDKFITLSTCEYSNKNGRLVVIARKV
jgi:sortase B